MSRRRRNNVVAPIFLLYCAMLVTLILVSIEWFLVRVLVGQSFPFLVAWRIHFLGLVGLLVLAIVALGTWATTKALMTARRWRSSYREVKGYQRFLFRALDEGVMGLSIRDSVSRFFRAVGHEESFRKYLRMRSRESNPEPSDSP